MLTRRWTLVAYGYGLLVVAGIAYVQLGMPIQLTDGYTLMESLPARPLATGIHNEFFQASFLRPLLWAQRRVLFTLADGRYFEWFRGWDVVGVLLAVGLSIRLWQPRTRLDCAVVPLGLAMLVGMHTFVSAMSEAFPVNPYLSPTVWCLMAAALALGVPRWWRDVAAVALFAFAALSVESGLLVWAVFAAAYLAGARGVSRGAVLVLTILFGGYFYLRFGLLDVGSPGLIERSSGYGFAVRSPAELTEMFGARPYVFRAYNVLTSALSVLWSEPRGGVWRFVAALRAGEVPLYAWINVLASVLATSVLVHFVWRRRQAWLARRFDAADRLVFIFIGLLAANAVLSFPYTKDEILTPAGAFYALAVAVAVRDLLIRASAVGRPSPALVLFLAVLSSVWTVRAVGFHLTLRESTHDIRNEWAYVDQWMADERKGPVHPELQRVQQRLYGDAISRQAQTPALSGEWVERWFGVE